MLIGRRALAVGLLLAGLWFGQALPAQPPGEDLNDLAEKMTKDAARKVAPSVVQISTQGGADTIVTDPKKGVIFRKAMGPTTGVIVSEDGYVISSAFNFVNNPTTIQVIIPGEEKPAVAKRIATDRSRMLTLLKVERKGLPVPAVVAKNDIKVGQWAIALGRTLELKLKKDTMPSISVGIISALNRIWGKALQTDAKVSPVNYGGPLVDIQGRVQGILIPASQRQEGETAGFEWYDSGIGFAVPMEDVLAVLPRLKEGKDLGKAELGIGTGADEIGAEPKVTQVTPGSAADKAGIKVGDVIQELDGKPVANTAQIKHVIGAKYEGDKITAKVKRGNDTVAVAIDLTSSKTAYVHPFMGILAVRDDPELGVQIRYVYPKSAADKAGLKEGDRIVKVAAAGKEPAGFTGEKRGRDQLQDILNGLTPGADLALEVLRKEGKKTDKVTVKLEAMPGTALTREDFAPEKIDAEATIKKALDPLKTSDPNAKPMKKDPPAKEIKKGLAKRSNAAGNREYFTYVPNNYDPNISYALLVWLHLPGKTTEEEMEKVANTWEDYCKENHVILVMPRSEGEEGWVPAEIDVATDVVRDVLATYTVDRNRIAVHGMGIGGQMAIYLGFNARDLVRGVATTGAVVLEPGDNVANQRLRFFLACGDRDPLVRAVQDSKQRLIDKRIPVWYRELPNRGREYLDEATFRELVMWLETLDRL